MDTVTEARLAIALAQEGGIGIVHKNLSPKQQAAEVAKVKRYESGRGARPDHHSARDERARGQGAHRVAPASPACPSSKGKRVVGIVTNRDLRFETRLDQPVRAIMTPRERLVTVREGATLDEAKALMHGHRLERVLVVNEAFELRGADDGEGHPQVEASTRTPARTIGKLRVGAAVGVGKGTDERVAALVEAGADVLVVDTAHGHAQGVLDRVRWIKSNFPRIAGRGRETSPRPRAHAPSSITAPTA